MCLVEFGVFIGGHKWAKCHKQISSASLKSMQQDNCKLDRMIKNTRHRAPIFIF